MKTKHTPGDWVARVTASTIIGEQRVPNYITVSTNEEARFEGKLIARIPVAMPSEMVKGSKSGEMRNRYYYDKEEAEANARLIAAAPKMLEALELLTEEIKCQICGKRSALGPYADKDKDLVCAETAIMEAESIIKEAKGGEG